MKTLNIKINLDNAAFYDDDDNYDFKPEVKRILQLIIDKDLEMAGLRDVNGNLVGSLTIA